MGELIHLNFEEATIAVCPECDSDSWKLLINKLDGPDQKVFAYECGDCGWFTKIVPVVVDAVEGSK